MLFLLFQLRQDRYALDARELVDILPLVQIQYLPHAPIGIAGMVDYHGEALPVIDLSELALGRTGMQRISTRILVVATTGGRRFALIAERANETLQKEATDFVTTEVQVDAAPYLGPVTHDARGIVQWITPQRLFSTAVFDALFHEVKEAA